MALYGRSDHRGGDARTRPLWSPGCTASRSLSRTVPRCSLAVPWKYGFKHVKSIVPLHLHRQASGLLLGEDPGPSEYGFWANVNPKVPHPRWSQASERVLGSNDRIPTLSFSTDMRSSRSPRLYKNIKGEKHVHVSRDVSTTPAVFQFPISSKKKPGHDRPGLREQGGFTCLGTEGGSSAQRNASVSDPSSETPIELSASTKFSGQGRNANRMLQSQQRLWLIWAFGVGCKPAVKPQASHASLA